MRLNSFTYIKYFCSLIIVFAHSVSFLGISDIRIPAFVVPVFFCISGYFVYESLLKEKSNFLTKRFIRIYPKLWLCLIINSIIVAILHNEVVYNKDFYVYNFMQGTIFQFFNPNSLSFYGMGSLNPSLWTLTIFTQFYILIYFSFCFFKNCSIKKDIFIFITLFILSTIISFLGSYCYPIYSLLSKTVFSYGYLFYIGIFFSKYKTLIIKFFKVILVASLCVFIISLLFERTLDVLPHIPYVANPFVSASACVFFMIVGLYFKVNKAIADLSYDIYLYHMIIINLFVELGIVGSYYLILIVIAISFFVSLFTSKLINIILNKNK